MLDADSAALLADDLANKLARIDNRAGRKILASTQTLQAWLDCLQTKGTQGPPGPGGPKGDPGTNGTKGADGQGLYPNLPKILDIGWRFQETQNLTQFASNYLATGTAAVTGAEQIVRRVTSGQNVPPLTIYFNKKMEGITHHTLEVKIDAPFAITEGSAKTLVSAGIYFPVDLKVYGDIVTIPGPVPTPHTNEQAAFAITFVPKRQFFWVLNANDQPQMALPYMLLWFLAIQCDRAQLDKPRVTVSLKGDFVYQQDPNSPYPDGYSELGVLDADNIGGRVGFPSPPFSRLPPLTGGNNPSGDMTQGGLFESWFFLSAKDSEAPPTMHDQVAGSLMMRSFSPAILGLADVPPAVNLSTHEDMTNAGISDPLARRIIAERKLKSFAGASDLRARVKISDRDWQAIKDKMMIL